MYVGSEVPQHVASPAIPSELCTPPQLVGRSVGRLLSGIKDPPGHMERHGCCLSVRHRKERRASLSRRRNDRYLTSVPRMPAIEEFPVVALTLTESLRNSLLPAIGGVKNLHLLDGRQSLSF